MSIVTKSQAQNPSTASPAALCPDQGIDVACEPRFLAEQSDPTAGRFVFSYRITIRNRGTRWTKLLSRRWIIIDADGARNLVEGDGVVGRQPALQPGESFEYSSYCPLATEWGTMEGVYVFARDDGDRFEIPIPRFYLVAPRSPAGA